MRIACTGPLPKVMPASLEVLDLSGCSSRNPHKFTGGLLAEWGSMTNLKELQDSKLMKTTRDSIFIFDLLGILNLIDLFIRLF